MSLMKYKAVCFDIDGTLYPVEIMNRKLRSVFFSHPLFAVRFRKLRADYRKRQTDFASSGLDTYSFRKREAAVFLGTAYNEASLDRAYRYIDRSFYSPLEKQYREIRGFNGLEALFGTLSERGIKLGLMSDFPLFDRPHSLGIDTYCNVMLSCDDTGYLKPDHRCFDMLAERLGVAPSEVLYVGDSYVKDVEGAYNAGMDGILVNCKKGSAEDYPHAVAIFGSWEDFVSGLLLITEEKR